MGVSYVTREETSSSPDIKASAYAAPQIDRCNQSASRAVEKLCHRVFYPWTGTRYLDFPNSQDARSGRLWLDENELISLATFVSGGVTVPAANYFLEPNASGPPYTSLNINRATTSALAMGTTGTAQRSLALTGVFGGSATEESAGVLSSAIVSTSISTITVSTPSGVGSLIRVDTERMIVTGRTFVTSSQTGTLAASNAAQSLAVSDGTVFTVGEELILDAERLVILEILGNSLIVARAAGGSTLAAHTTATIFWAHQLTVERGAVGTTAATHLNGATVARNLPPSLVKELSLAYSLDMFFQAGSGYARTIGSGDAERQASGRGIRDLEEKVYGAYGRRYRRLAV